MAVQDSDTDTGNWERQWHTGQFRRL